MTVSWQERRELANWGVHTTRGRGDR
uniref:Uncharacterized protein n=1 Tax=Anguilla anguilla TaxID=7936 RepID=A0A0E9S7M2_ANGAN